MSTPKNKHFTEQQIQIANLAKALGHPARVAIIDYLQSVDTCICGDIVDELPLTQSTVSQHLKVLKTAGLIKGNIEGNAICYCIDSQVFEVLKSYISPIIQRDIDNACC